MPKYRQRELEAKKREQDRSKARDVKYGYKDKDKDLVLPELELKIAALDINVKDIFNNIFKDMSGHCTEESYSLYNQYDIIKNPLETGLYSQLGKFKYNDLPDTLSNDLVKAINIK